MGRIMEQIIHLFKANGHFLYMGCPKPFMKADNFSEAIAIAFPDKNPSKTASWLPAKTGSTVSVSRPIQALDMTTPEKS